MPNNKHNQKLLQKLRDMVDKTYLYNGHYHKILSFNAKNGSITIVTDKEWLEITSESQLKSFLPVEDEETAARELSVI
nr:hypothetical protein [Candidatus Saccharibacteria bacterium]NIV03483.1 hypothetical protein [Calditrichia bacterium]NIV71705.1 hypothetical protein [Calditrichia bacterium]NIV98360.1 hypothetical protein [Candidatus Saccharibacteria bacterium]NIW78644.1 hypothetical protein [Calditrichia bacterium]